MNKRLFIWLSLIFLLGACQKESATLTLATTTSTHDSGLLDVILADFEAQFSAKVDVIAVGTGQALALGEAGDADVILVHARSREDAFVAAGYGINRRDVMYNDFVLIGPESDPAGIAGIFSISDALQQIADTESIFVSRGDDSGTNIREVLLWENAGIFPTPNNWYQSIGQGMGATLTFANEENGYTLTDRGTFISRQDQAGFGLMIMVEGDENLFNPYGIIAINPALHDNVDIALANQFITWITSASTQKAIGDYRRNEQQLFFPNANPDADPILGKPTQNKKNDNLFLSTMRQAGEDIFSGNTGLWHIVRLSLGVSGMALIIAGTFGIPLGAWLGLHEFPGQRWLTAFIYTGMGFPPVVVGLIVYLLLSANGIFGRLDWLFTPTAMVLAQTILALPLVAGVTMTAVQGVSHDLRPQLQTLGATKWQILGTILQEARAGVLVGLVAGFGAAISEVGAVMLVGGNIAGKTRVLTTAIVLETRQGNFNLALALGAVLLTLAFLTNIFVVKIQGNNRRW